MVQKLLRLTSCNYSLLRSSLNGPNNQCTPQKSYITTSTTSSIICLKIQSRNRLINSNYFNYKPLLTLSSNRYTHVTPSDDIVKRHMYTTSFKSGFKSMSMIGNQPGIMSTTNCAISKRLASGQSKDVNKKEEEELVIKIDDFKEDRLHKVPARTRLKLLIRDYGSAVFVVHIAISLTSLGSIYSLLKLGLPIQAILNPTYFDKLGVGGIDMSVIATGSTFVIAYALHKCIMPLRIGATCIAAPALVKYARNRGWLSPIAPPPKPGAASAKETPKVD